MALNQALSPVVPSLSKSRTGPTRIQQLVSLMVDDVGFTLLLLQGIRQKKLQELKTSGVPEKYLAQLARGNFSQERLG